MIARLEAALVIARRDYVATVWSKTFLLFLIGPLFPILFGLIFGAVGASVDRDALRPKVAVVSAGAEASAIAAAALRLGTQLGPMALPEVKVVAPQGDPSAQAKALLADKRAGVVAVVTGGLIDPSIAGPRAMVRSVEGDIRLLLETAQTDMVLAHAGQRRAPVALDARYSDRAAGADSNARLLTARGAQLILVMLTMILAGMLLSNLIEEKSNKVIEVLAAAVPVDAIFFGKLMAMLGMSLTGIAVWGGAGAAAAFLLAPDAMAALPAPAVGWPMFMGLGIAYFITSYLLLGALFLAIGAQASTVREVQTLSMPVTMGQLIVFAFASAAVGKPDAGIAQAAMIFPWSSPFAMIARAAQEPGMAIYLAALLWQALWVAIIIRVGARMFRRSVLKSGGPRRRWFGRR